ncbi:uncharacterized protein BDW43DRAFT_25684 [Aspergillus alliaceus]|uniref:uncharacterized protein n=1 Tax=Petromyces alliaceus TaxID=209559 RepID=UPI0012A75F22|nr:uncharacterized protein BDW43DRAFT_25684 [Aspergillus alliaceus]KAB8235728.1 hypothetical protein BDW43DRAFT_25684 [Aspergillus alliaceus]
MPLFTNQRGLNRLRVKYFTFHIPSGHPQSLLLFICCIVCLLSDACHPWSVYQRWRSKTANHIRLVTSSIAVTTVVSECSARLGTRRTRQQ